MSSEKGDYRVVIEDKDTNEPSPSQQHNSNVVAPSVVKLSPAARAALPIISYCIASILMTVTNKYVVSGYDFNMNFLLLSIQVSCSFFTTWLIVISQYLSPRNQNERNDLCVPVWVPLYLAFAKVLCLLVQLLVVGVLW